MRMRDWRGCRWRWQLDRIGSKVSDEVIGNLSSLCSSVSLLRKSRRRRIEIVCGYGLNRRLGLGRWTGKEFKRYVGDRWTVLVEEQPLGRQRVSTKPWEREINRDNVWGRELNKGKHEMGFCGINKSEVVGFGEGKIVSLSFSF